MANYETDVNDGLVDKRKVGRITALAVAPNLAAPANYNDILAMRTRLAAINGAYFTATRLNQMTRNDMIYAIRVNDDLLGIR